jgi:transposase
MKGIEFENGTLNAVFEEYRVALDRAVDWLQRLTQSIENLGQTDEYKKPVAALMSLRGVKTITAMTIVSEIGDMRRFGKAKEFMAAIGLVPSEYSSGNSIRRGSITKTGNAHVRRVLVESAWHYRHRPTVGKGIKERRAGQPLEVVTLAQKADTRLCSKFRKMVNRGKRATTAAVATARELAGFIWSIGQKVHA